MHVLYRRRMFIFAKLCVIKMACSLCQIPTAKCSEDRRTSVFDPTKSVRSSIATLQDINGLGIDTLRRKSLTSGSCTTYETLYCS
ncbi:hypothetical protein V8E53_007685 [Lactarius tabidus]